MRDRSIDIGKGLAILFVYLGHSILYHPIQMNTIPWCHVMERIIVSFNMPMFFIISGYLFSKTKKSTLELYKAKTLRILIPYITTMLVIIGVKLILPQEMSYNQAVGGGVTSMLRNALLYGGDRWFVYTLFFIFLILIPARNYLSNRWVDFGLITLLIVVYFLDFMPTIFALNKVFHYMIFFVAGFALNAYYPRIKQWSLKNWWFVFAIFILCNFILIMVLNKVAFVFRFVLPFTGTLGVMALAFQLEKMVQKSKVVQYIEYCGKYSLQFYLFTFAYPIIRTVIVSVLHIANPFIILISVFILQLIATTIIVEITRRIKWLKIPCGY